MTTTMFAYRCLLCDASFLHFRFSDSHLAKTIFYAVMENKAFLKLWKEQHCEGEMPSKLIKHNCNGRKEGVWQKVGMAQLCGYQTIIT